MMNDGDAKERSLENGKIVRVTSRVGSIDLPLEVTENIARGVVSIPHGYGHGRTGIKLDVATEHSGVSINDLTDETVIDALTGNAAFSGLKVRIETRGLA